MQPRPDLLKAATAGARLVFVYLPLGLVAVLTAVSVATAGSEWLEYGTAALAGTLLVFFVPGYLIYRLATRRVRRMLERGEPARAVVTRAGRGGHPGIHELTLSFRVGDREVKAQLAMAKPPGLAAGDRVDLIVGPGMFCALIPGVGAEIGRYQLPD